MIVCISYQALTCLANIHRPYRALHTNLVVHHSNLQRAVRALPTIIYEEPHFYLKHYSKEIQDFLSISIKKSLNC